MSIQTQKQKRKKSYSQLLEEIRSVMSKTAAVYVPELCTELAVENPNLSNKELRSQIHLDLEGIWSVATIEHFFPSWILDQSKVKSAKKAWETKNANKLKSVEKIITEFKDVQIPSPPTAKSESVSEEVDEQLSELGMARIGETGKTISALYGDITESAAALFKALTGKYYMPNEDEDLTTEYIKPTREFRRGLALDLDEKRKTTLHNWLHYTSAAIEDMIEILNKS